MSRYEGGGGHGAAAVGGGGGTKEDAHEQDLVMPGFRFHPTEEELLEFYLKQAAHGRKLKFDIIPTVHLYRHDPWDLPALAGDIIHHGSSSCNSREWYFFVPRDSGRKLNQQQAAGRPSRTTERGFWKATGSDRAVRCGADPKRLIGLKKTLVYYQGRAPRGSKTDWVMNEYRLPEDAMAGGGGNNKVQLLQDRQELVLCKVYRKAVSLKELEQRVAMEELARSGHGGSSSAASSHCTGSPDAAGSMSSDVVQYEAAHHYDGVKIEEAAAAAAAVAKPAAMRLPELETTRMEWLSQPQQQDPFQLTSSQLRSPWMMESFCLSPCYQSSLLNF